MTMFQKNCHNINLIIFIIFITLLNNTNLFANSIINKSKKFSNSNYLITINSQNKFKASFKFKHLSIKNAYINTPIGNSSSTAAYMKISSKINDRIIKLSSPNAKKIEIHKTTMDKNDIMRMRKLDDLIISKSKTLILEPGGIHFMIIGLKNKLKYHDTFPLTIYFESGLKIDLELIALNLIVKKEKHHNH